MINLLRTLLAATAVLSLVPTEASALEACETACTCTTYCGQYCKTPASIIQCGRYGLCIDLCDGARPDETASVTQDKAPQDDTSAPVCSEEQRDAELSASLSG